MVEEAAEVLEAHILTSLCKGTEHLILIGDHEQLRPKPQLHELQVESGRGFNLDLSLFERLVKQGTVPMSTLRVQRRMHPDISRYASIQTCRSVYRCTEVKKDTLQVFSASKV